MNTENNIVQGLSIKLRNEFRLNGDSWDWTAYAMWLEEKLSQPKQHTVEGQDEMWREVGKIFTGIVGNSQWVDAIEKAKSKFKISQQGNQC